MSAKITLGSTLGGLVLLIIIGVIVITGSKANEENSLAAKQQSIQNNKDIDALNKTFNQFVDQWTERVRIGNTNTNTTQDKIDRGVQNIIGNLSAHRIIANLSDHNQTLILRQVLNATHALTGPEYEKLADERVNAIVSNLSADHEIIFKALNISKTDKVTDAEQLGQLVKQFIEEQKKNEPKRP